jgi:hypothetical protein
MTRSIRLPGAAIGLFALALAAGAVTARSPAGVIDESKRLAEIRGDVTRPSERRLDQRCPSRVQRRLRPARGDRFRHHYAVLQRIAHVAHRKHGELIAATLDAGMATSMSLLCSAKSPVASEPSRYTPTS